MDSRTQQRIVVGVSGSLNSLVALQHAGTEAQLTGRRILAVLAWPARAGDSPSRTRRSQIAPKDARSTSLRLLRDSLNDVFAATDVDLHIDGLAICGAAGRTLVQIANKESDLLVIGGGHRNRFGRWRSPVAHYVVTHAVCPVLTVPPSPLQLDLEALTRKKKWLRRITADDPLQALRHTLRQLPAYIGSDC